MATFAEAAGAAAADIATTEARAATRLIVPLKREDLRINSIFLL
jgi:hypothetical protein